MQVGAFVSTTRLVRIATGARKDTTATLCRAPLSTVNCVRALTREVAFWSERTRSFVWNVPRDMEVNMRDVTTNAFPQCLVRVFRDFNFRGFLQALDATSAVTVTSEIQPGRTDRSAFANRATAIQMSIRTESVTATGRPAIVWSVSTTRVERSATNVYRVSSCSYNTMYHITLYLIICAKHFTNWYILQSGLYTNNGLKHCWKTVYLLIMIKKCTEYALKKYQWIRKSKIFCWHKKILKNIKFVATVVFRILRRRSCSRKRRL